MVLNSLSDLLCGCTSVPVRLSAVTPVGFNICKVYGYTHWLDETDLALTPVREKHFRVWDLRVESYDYMFFDQGGQQAHYYYSSKLMPSYQPRSSLGLVVRDEAKAVGMFQSNTVLKHTRHLKTAKAKRTGTPV